MGKVVDWKTLGVSDEPPTEINDLEVGNWTVNLLVVGGGRFLNIVVYSKSESVDDETPCVNISVHKDGRVAHSPSF